jgi:hypothetical protein
VTTVAIVPENQGDDGTTYRAVAGSRHAVGKTAGEALDALTAQLSEEEAGTIVVVQSQRPDRFFTAEQQERLTELMGRWRTARDTGSALPPDEQAELDQLTDAELQAATRRAQALLNSLTP